MAITRTKKEETIGKITDSFQKADLLMFLGFRGLSVANASELRRKLRETGARYIVAKKRLIQLALKNKGIEMPQVEGEVAFIFAGKELSGGVDDTALAAAKEVQAFAKAHKEEVSILGGIFEAMVIDASAVARLAQIPSRDALIAHVMGILQGPLCGLVRTLNGNQKKLVVALGEIAARK
jgi:large subunit ribosomal protein L10